MPNPTPKPTQVGGHLPPPSVHPIFAQQIDGKTYSTRTATLIHRNTKGEALYYDTDPGYFLVTVTRFNGLVPMYAVSPLSDDGLKQWATVNGVMDKVSSTTAKVLVSKLMATKSGAAALTKLVRSRT